MFAWFKRKPKVVNAEELASRIDAVLPRVRREAERQDWRMGCLRVAISDLERMRAMLRGPRNEWRAHDVGYAHCMLHEWSSLRDPLVDELFAIANQFRRHQWV
jgi:hypothetical protein